MGFFSQLRLLLWKNLLLQKHKVVVSIFEVVLPLLFAVLILTLRLVTKPDTFKEPTPYPEKSVMSRAYLSFMDTETLLKVRGQAIGFTPDSPHTRRVMERVRQRVTLVTMTDIGYDVRILRDNGITNVTVDNFLSIKGFDSEDALVKYYKLHSDFMRHGVVFEGTDQANPLPKDLTVYVRPYSNDNARWRTRSTYPFYQDNSPRAAFEPNYLGSLFAQLQSIVVAAMAEEWSGSQKLTFPDLYVRRMPFPPYVTDPMVGILQQQLPLFLVLSFILSVILNTKSIVYEKERKLKESMKLMGLMPAAHWASWFITCFLYLAVAMAIYTILFGVNIIKKSGPVLAFTDPSLFYVFLLCYAASIVSYCFMISVFVNKANVGAAVSGVMFFAFYFPNFFLQSRYETMTSPQKLAACLLFNQAMAFGANVIGLHEGTGEGAQWSNVHRPASVDDNFTLLDAMIMLLVDTLLHLLLTWYLDNVRPGEFGVPRPPYFCFTKSYWCGSKASKAKLYAQGADQDEKHFEPDPMGLRAGVRISNLRKAFAKNKVAVDNLSLNMYEGQITVLLGHNGAGKTTTMSMLTGFIPPTSGTAYIDDKDIRTDITSIRESLGLCPQHNILFGTLTVQEHLTFFAELKGCPSKQVKQEVDTMIREVGLEEKRNAAARTLSGGQKRKLSVGIALIYGSKIVILDEPTSGMDPAARRQTWDVLQRHRAGRTMLLTTHFMDEADLLGDRIAIMAEGVVKCCGTSMFLKKLYGAGYHLVIVKSPGCQVSQVSSLILKAIPSARLESDINAELTYLLPDSQSALFPDLFQELDAQREALGITNFGASATTMEEVFLKVGESASSEEDEALSQLEGAVNNGFTVNSKNIQEQLVQNGKTETAEQNRLQSMSVANDGAALDVLAFSRGYQKVTGASLVLSRLRGVVTKKAIFTWRNRYITLAQLLLPVIFTVVALAVDKARPETLADPPLLFNLDPFSDTSVGYASGPDTSLASDAMAAAYKDQIPRGQDVKEVQFSINGTMDDWFLSQAERLGTAAYNKRVIIGGQFQNQSETSFSNATEKVTAWYNGQPFHALPVSLTYALNALASYYVNETVNMKMGINPLPKDAEEGAGFDIAFALAMAFVIGFCISIGMAFLASSFIYFLVKERAGGAKHMQIVSGVGPLVFWLGNFLWDYINYILPSLLLLVVFAGYGTEPYVEDGHLGLVVLVLLVYGWAILPFIYLAHFLFKSPPTSMVVAIVFNIFSGLLTTLAVFIMLLIPDTQDLGETLNWVFMVLFPNHCMGRSFMEIYSNYYTTQICTDSFNYTFTCLTQAGVCCKNYGMGCKDNCISFNSDYLAWEAPGIGRYLTFMVLHGIVFFSLTLMLEYRLLQRLCNFIPGCNSTSSNTSQPFYLNGTAMTAEDDDVAAERRRITASPASILCQREPLLLVNLYKQYGSFVAVDHSCVGVPEQECFGLLGQNGAGKTTTFKMLTGDVPVTGGNAYLKGYDVKSNLSQVQANMGYCPQFDALIDQMTGRETLYMYARLRGVPETNIKKCVNALIDVLLLRPHADKLTSEYSGGNKRKLSTAMALIGDPPFILLDEPSSGMDPGARRQLWNVLSQVRASGRTLVLTSHSMDECEALCTRLAIMVNGRFVCLGSTQHLKSKFGQGYTLVARMKMQDSGVTAPTQPLVAYVQQCFPSTILFDSHQGYAHMQVPDPNVRLAEVFGVMERAKRELEVLDYNVHQTTLEQVFLAFTTNQVPPKEPTNKSCLKKFCCCCC